MKKILITFFLMGILFSCNNNEENLDLSKRAININPELSEYSNDNPSYITNSIINSGDIIGIYAFNPDEGADALSKSSCKNIQYLKTDKGWEQKSSIYWGDYGEANKVGIIGYYPYSDNIEDNKYLPIDVPSNQSAGTGLKGTDYLLGMTLSSQTSENQPINLSLNHALTKLILHIHLSNNSESLNATISDVRFHAKLIGKINLLDSNTILDDNTYDITPYHYDIPFDDDSYTYEAIIPSQTFNKENIISFIIDGEKHSITLSKKLEIGVCYNMNLNISKNRPTVFSVSPSSIDDWNEEKIDDDIDIGMSGLEYEVGDIWPNENDPQAIVVRAKKMNLPGIMMHIDNEVLPFCTDETQGFDFVSTGITTHPEKIYLFKEYLNNNNIDISKYPAYQYCFSLGDNWFIPSSSSGDANLGSIEINYNLAINWCKYIADYGETTKLMSSYIWGGNRIDVLEIKFVKGNNGINYSRKINYQDYKMNNSIRICPFSYF